MTPPLQQTILVIERRVNQLTEVAKDASLRWLGTKPPKAVSCVMLDMVGDGVIKQSYTIIIEGSVSVNNQL